MNSWRKLIGPLALGVLGGIVFLLPASWGADDEAPGDLIILSTTYVKGDVTPCG